MKVGKEVYDFEQHQTWIPTNFETKYDILHFDQMLLVDHCNVDQI